MLTMDDKDVEPPYAEDFLIWRQSIVNYIQESPDSCLHLQTGPQKWLNLEYTNTHSIFDALVGSGVTEINLEGAISQSNVKHLINALSKTEVRKLTLRSCDLSTDDFLSLMAILKKTQITELELSWSYPRLRRPQQVREFFFHLMKSRLRSLTLGGILLPFKKRPDFFQKLTKTKITCLELTDFFSESGELQNKHKEQVNRSILNLQFTFVTNLDLGSNGLGDFLAKSLGAILKKTKLEKLILSYNWLTDAGVKFLIPGLLGSEVTHLDLSRNSINGDNDLGRVLKNTKIRVLDLAYNPVREGRMLTGFKFLRGSNVRVLSLCHSLKKRKLRPKLNLKDLSFSRLTFLDLSENRLSFDHINQLAGVLSESNITVMKLCNNSFFNAESFRVLGDCFIKSKLKHIDLSDIDPCQPFFENEIALLVGKMEGSPIVSLNLSSNFYTSNIQLITRQLANTKLLALNLGCIDNREHFNDLAIQLKYTDIVELHLMDNKLQDEHAVALAHCLPETRMVKLGLSNNHIGDDGAKALAMVLKNTRIRHLNLRGNQIGNDGLKSLAENAKNSCITYLNVECNQANGILLVESVVTENLKNIKMFSDLLNKTALLTGDSGLFEFNRNFDGIDVCVFIEYCLRLYRLVAKVPLIVNSIEQDRCVANLMGLKTFEVDMCCGKNEDFIVYNEDCSLIHEKILELSLIRNATKKDQSVSFFTEQILRLILDEFPLKLVSFIGRAVEANVERNVSLLKRVEEFGLNNILELLLSNRSMYMIEENQEILHPYVYLLLHKRKHPICNLDVDPMGVEKIIEYFIKNDDLNGAREVVALLNGSKLKNVVSGVKEFDCCKTGFRLPWMKIS